MNDIFRREPDRITTEEALDRVKTYTKQQRQTFDLERSLGMDVKEALVWTELQLEFNKVYKVNKDDHFRALNRIKTGMRDTNTKNFIISLIDESK